MDAAIKTLRRMDFSLTEDGKISCCLANSYFGIGDTIQESFSNELRDLEGRKEANKPIDWQHSGGY